MHELSIASSILAAARRHLPPGAVLRSVRVRAGPLRGIDPEALDWAWRATVAGTDAEGTCVQLDVPRWRLRCTACGEVFDATDPYAPCPCGSGDCHPGGGDELIITSIEVDDPAALPAGGRSL